MTETSAFVAMIPARIGSTRLKMKNLALIGGRPMISYAIEAAQTSGAFDRVVLNADHRIFEEIAARHGVDFYLRPTALGSSTTKSDEVVMDFIRHHPCRRVAWVNPTSPLQTGREVRAVADSFVANAFDSLITVAEEQVHCVMDGRPVNFRPDEPFAQTQDLTPVGRFVYSVMAWRSDAFVESYERNGFAFFCGRTGYFPVSKLSAVIVKRQEDLILADALLRAVEATGARTLEYDRLADDLDRNDA